MTNHVHDDRDVHDGGEALARALDDLARGASPDVPTTRLDAVRARVRRRRAAKRTAIGAATLGVVGVLAVGVTRLPTWETGEPLPAGPPTDLAAACGTTVDLDPEPGADLTYAVRLDGDAQVRTGDEWSGMLRVEDATDRVDEAVRLTDVGLVATRDGEVVGTPAGPVVPSQDTAAVNGSSGPVIDARFLACGTGEALAPGTYDVYAEATLRPGAGELAVVAGPVAVDVVDDEQPSATGHQPGWLAGTDLVCGMSADALAALTDPGLSLTTHGPSGEVAGVVDVTLTNEGTTPLAGVTAIVAPVAWVRDDVVVSVGPNMFESPLPLDLDPGETVSLGAEAVPTDYCSPDDDGTYPTPVAPGDYDLVPYQGVLRDGTSAGDEIWAVGTAVPVTLDEAGTITPRG